MKLWISAALLIALTAAGAHAQEKDGGKADKDRKRERKQGPTAEKLLEKADADKDGRISKEEFLREAYAKWSKGQKKGGPGAKRLDKDGDGEVSYEEFAAAPMANDHFKRLDKDGSGYLEKAEVESLATDLGRDQRKAVPEFVKRFDDDGDGKVSREEFKGADAVFKRMDRNGDGFVDPGDEPQGGGPAAPPSPVPPGGAPTPPPDDGAY